jgi:hypothetical protein
MHRQPLVNSCLICIGLICRVPNIHGTPSWPYFTHTPVFRASTPEMDICESTTSEKLHAVEEHRAFLSTSRFRFVSFIEF